MAPQGFFGSALDANVVAPVRVRGEFVRTDPYAASSARPIALLGAGLIATIIAAGLFGSAAPATAQDGYGTHFGYDDHAAERLQQRYSRRAVRRSRAPSSDHHTNTAEKKLKKSENKEVKTSAPQGAVDAVVPLADQHVANTAEKKLKKSETRRRRQAAREAEPDAKSKAPTASLDAQPKTSEWPEFIGAKERFGAVKEPAPLAARAIGTYARGCLSGAVALPIDGPAWQEMRLSRNRNRGHPKLIALIEQFAKDAQKLDGWPGLLVGDIAQPRGGPMITGHASHQVGLDADFWLTPMPDRRLTAKEREDLQAATMLDGTGLAVDPKVFTDKQVALIKRAASYPEVERIFVHPAIKKALCQVAGTDRKWLGKVRPFYGHSYHLHMRIKCPPGFAGCKPQTPPTGADGCGKEVNQWLARVVPAKTPAFAPPPPVSTSSKPPVSTSSKPPIMLSELPKDCKLFWGPNRTRSRYREMR